MNRILVPTDFSPHAARALDYALAIARKTDSRICLLHIGETAEGVLMDNVIPAELLQKGLDAPASEQLAMLKKSIEETETVPLETSIAHGPIVESILITAKEWKASLIIVGTLGITGLRETIFGSKTAALIGQSPIPVLAIPLEYEGGAPAKIALAIHDASEAGDQLQPLYELTTAFHAPLTLTSFTDTSYIAPTEFSDEIQELNKAVAMITQKLRYTPVEAKQLVGKQFIENINQFIEENGYNLIAMTTHERSFLGSILKPSLTKKMSYKTKVPLLALPKRS